MPNAVEPVREHVDKKATDELAGGQGHDLLPVASLCSVVLPFECDAGAIEPDEPAVRDGNPVGVARQIGEYGFRAGRKRIFLPRELQAEEGLDLRDFFELRPSAATARIVRRVAQEARDRLARARARKAEVSAAARRALMLAVLADRYLLQLDRVGYDPFDARLAEPSRGNAWRLGTAALLRKY